MSKVLLVGVKTIKAESVIEENVDDKILAKVIFNAQEIELKEVLGSTLYNTVCNEVAQKVANNSYNIPEQLKTLIDDYIQPYLIHVTVANFIAINNYKISNKGVQKLNDNSSTSISASEVESIKNYYDNYVSTFKKNLIKFLKDNQLDGSYTDTNITSPATGWLIETSNRCGDFYNYESLPNNPAPTYGIDELAPIGTNPNPTAATITGRILNLEPASATQGGVLTNDIQEIGGFKTFQNGALITANEEDFSYSATVSVQTNSIDFAAYSNSTGGVSKEASMTFQDGNILIRTPSTTNSGRGITGDEDYSSNITATDYTQKSYVDGQVATKENHLTFGTGLSRSGNNITLSINPITQMAAIGNTPNANAATISGNILTLQPASVLFGGVVTTSNQSFGGDKCFIGKIGIGNTSPSEKLDVTGAIRLSGAIKPNGDAGSAGQYLCSTGSTTAPIWDTPKTIFNSSGNVEDNRYVSGNGEFGISILSGQTGITLDPAASITLVGDVENSGNGTLIVINDADGTIQIGNPFNSTTLSQEGLVYSGTYEPSVYILENASECGATEWQYIRVGNVVTVSGAFNLHTTGGNASSTVMIDLPIPSYFTAPFQLTGTAMPAVSYQDNAYTSKVYANNDGNANMMIEVFPTATKPTYYVHATYQIKEPE